MVFEGAYALDRDADDIAAGEGEVVAGDDSGAGHEEDALREGVVAEEIADEFERVAFELGQRGLAGEDGGSGAKDFDVDNGRPGDGFFR